MLRFILHSKEETSDCRYLIDFIQGRKNTFRGLNNRLALSFPLTGCDIQKSARIINPNDRSTAREITFR